MAKGKGLGKGLGAIFQTENSKVEINENDKILEISLDKIQKNPYQPRTIFDQDKIDELAESIEKNGLLQPIILKKTLSGYYIIAGERRYRASQKLGLEKISAIVKDISDEDMMVFAILENLQREDLSVLEEASSYQQLIENLGLKQEELAKRLGKSRPYVANTLRLLNLPLEVKEMLASGKISAGHAKVLLSIKDKNELLLVANKLVKEKMSVRALEEYLAKEAKPKVKKVIKKDEYIAAEEERLKKRLGTSINIKQAKNNSGKIEIEFKDIDEYQRIVDLLG
ncbi:MULTISPECIES: ParB/RepB/Spo0J family partition protein [unclassified Gemella]|uniref:ParB/RepB/Spo0J family partition protein n=1 Tax=unclassified Gemella TaxID=2624949 RepID=UPI001072FA5E|nr:ParB/RepB/Spo0J family partition protein [Gemella sp. GL1.1]MBF0746646.1 ParB/RepB/Spo0J family partition protein [Gemella sp. 19428wG2_WT2a]NYS28129.1 ParB/RepB/Spo0J family partition protein [Gemella sp. GL1]TFU59998.1 ParB/RepB/Spo0J family partition protein [Gemella sp. WT2a]